MLLPHSSSEKDKFCSNFKFLKYCITQSFVRSPDRVSANHWVGVARKNICVNVFSGKALQIITAEMLHRSFTVRRSLAVPPSSSYIYRTCVRISPKNVCFKIRTYCTLTIYNVTGNILHFSSKAHTVLRYSLYFSQNTKA